MIYFASESIITLTVLLSIITLLVTVVLVGIVTTKHHVIKKKPGTDTKIEG